ncbi:MAG: glucose-6-phosphate isomerase, partial [Elusimicrobiota bacterium]|nr:glucose-6-phosphate isomerase [Elusimicrobiota bacterium]
MNNLKLQDLKIWKDLSAHYEENKGVHLKQLFENSNRFDEFSIQDSFLGLTFDYSKNLISKKTLSLLIELAKTAKVNEYSQKMFSGEKINWTEKRAVLHIALRNRSNKPIYVDGKDIMPQINAVLNKMEKFSDDLRSAKWTGATGKKITDIVNIGIGGSDLGPKMVCEALKYYAGDISVHFV